ncbi:MAG: putative Ig domain-containing protein [Akkermansiaceae bacterium]|nr:putative Ig domain-containing protein [Akkermansiaceae bacterium]
MSQFLPPLDRLAIFWNSKWSTGLRSKGSISLLLSILLLAFQTPAAFAQEDSVPVIISSLELRSPSNRAINYQIAANGNAADFTVDVLPGSLSLDSQTGLISGFVTTPGEYTIEISAENTLGTGSATLTLTIVEPESIGDLRILRLGNRNSTVVETNNLTGDDRAGIAVSFDRVVVTGDTSTASYSLSNLTEGRSLDARYDSLFSDFATGKVFVFGFDGVSHDGEGTTINQLIEIDPSSGQPTGLVVPLSSTIPVSPNSGVFSGNGRVVLHNGETVFDIIISTGEVSSLGRMSRPAWYATEGWASWGVAESFGNRIHLAYRGSENSGNTIYRTRVPDGLTEPISSFFNLGDLGSWTISPLTSRWYFQSEGGNQFGGSNEALGYAEALIDLGEPTFAPALQPPFEVRSFVTNFSYQIQASGFPTSFSASGLPQGLSLNPTTGVISGNLSEPGEYEVEIAATNSIGTSTESLALTVFAAPANQTLQIRELGETGSKVVDHNALTGDDRGGIAVGLDRVLVTGDSSTASYDLINLESGVSLGVRYDSLFTDLSNGTIFTMAMDGAPYNSNGPTVNQFIEVNPTTGELTDLVIPLSETIRINSGGGMFSGNGRLALYTNGEVIDIQIASGIVASRTPLARPSWYGTESWAIWGVAEYFGGQLYLAYRGGGNTANAILRTQVSNGFTETISTFQNLGDLGSWTVSPFTNRWYFHHEGGNQFGGTSETLGYADAVIDIGEPTEPPLILVNDSFISPTGRNLEIQIRGSGSPTSYGASDLPDGLTINSSTGLITGTPTTAGIYSVEIAATNTIGTSTTTVTLNVIEVPIGQTLRILQMNASGAQAVETTPFSGDDRAGIAVGFDRVLTTGDSATAGLDAEDLDEASSLGTRYDGIFSDLGSGTIYSFALNGVPHLDSSRSINQLLVLDPLSGSPTGAVIDLSSAIPVVNNCGVFSGAGRVVIHNGTFVFDIDIATGFVNELGSMPRPNWFTSEGWAVWGVAEFFNDQLHIAYRGTGDSANSFVRTQVPDGPTTTIATFDNLGDLSSWSISPIANRWYFQHEGTSQFSSTFNETLGFADATISIGASNRPPQIFAPADIRTLTGRDLEIRLRASGSPTEVEVTGLPDGIDFDFATGLISGSATTAGDYTIEVSATNAIGTSNASIAITVIGTVPLGDFRIRELSDTRSKVIDHNSLTGDDRAGIAVSFDRVFVTGDSSTASYNLDDLGNGNRLNRIVDGLCSDLANGLVFTLALDGVPHTNGSTAINQLIELDPVSGDPTPNGVINLSQTIPVSNISGVFSGGGRIVIHNGQDVFEIQTATGTVRALGAMTRPNWGGTDGWAAWGVAEFFGGELYITYREAGTNSITRARVPDGFTETVATFNNLGQTGSWTVSPLTNRWYFHYEGGAQFGGGSETLGYADAIIEMGNPTEPPVFTEPLFFRAVVNQDVDFQIRALRTPTRYSATGLPSGLTINEDTGRISGTVTTTGDFPVEVSATNIVGTTSQTYSINVIRIDPPRNLRILSLEDSGVVTSDAVAFMGDDRGGIAVSPDRVLVTGDSSTASFNREDLDDGRSTNSIVDGLFSDLNSGGVYTFGFDGRPHSSGASTINEIAELDPQTGVGTGLIIRLSQPISVSSSGCGIFAGAGRVVIHNRFEVFDIELASGTVTNLGTMAMPLWFNSESWSVWGVAEFFGNNLYLVYRGTGDSQNSFIRSQVPDGPTEKILTSFTNLGSLSTWTISPQDNRWYFQFEGTNQFGSVSQGIGYADAILDYGAPTEVPIFLGSLSPKVLITNFNYQIQASGSPTSFGASGLPDGLILNPTTGLITGSPSEPGRFPVEISATNAIGTSSTSITFDIFELTPASDLRIVELGITNSQVIDHDIFSGDDRSGIAVGNSRVLVTGDSATSSHSLLNLTGGRSLGIRYDSLCSDLATGAVYTLALNGVPHLRGGASFNQLLEIDQSTGRLTGEEINFDEEISVANGSGIFSGMGRVVVHNGAEVYDLHIETETATLVGGMDRPEWYISESWATWGVAEFFDGRIHLAYRSAESGTRNSILRARVPDGLTESIADFDNLGDMASMTVSPLTGRWYFLHEGSSQFGGGSETLGYADAMLEISEPTELPRILTPDTLRPLSGVAIQIPVRAGGSPSSYEVTDLPEGLTYDATSGLISGALNTAGEYQIDISATNVIGTSSATITITVLQTPSFASLQIRELRATGSQVIDHNALTGDDRAGIAVGFDRVLVTGDSRTASYDLQDLSGGVRLSTRYDSLFSDLSTGTIFTLGSDGVPHQAGGIINEIHEIDQSNGELTGFTIPLTQSIPTNSGGGGVFSGAGRVVVFTQGEVFDIHIATGIVVPRGSMPTPNWYGTEGWAVWGVAESFDNQLHLTYRSRGVDPFGQQDPNLIVRSRVPDGATEVVASFANLGDLGTWTISPITNRWYFHHEGGNEFGGSGETLGYADAVIEIGESNDPPRIFVVESQRVVSSGNIEIPIRISGNPTGIEVTGLPDGLTFSSSTGLISGSTTEPGTYQIEVSATNSNGTTSASFELDVFELPPVGELQIRELRSTGSNVIDHNSLTGDDRAGIAVGVDRVLVTGDSATASYGLNDLDNGVSLGTRYDSLFSDLSTGLIFTLALDGTPHTNGDQSVNQLIEIDPNTGQLTDFVISLSESVPLTSSGAGVFSGAGRVVIHNGTEVFDILIATGTVRPQGAMQRPNWYGTESWAVWGVAEFFNGQLYIAYRGGGADGNSFVRASVPDGITETISTFTSLGDLGTWTVSPLTNRWYFHNEGSNQFGGSSETLGYADAVIDLNIPSQPPFFVSSDPIKTIAGQNFSFQVRALGNPIRFSVDTLPIGLGYNPTTGLFSGSIANSGVYSIEISAENEFGISTQTIEIIAPSLDGKRIALFANETYVDLEQEAASVRNSLLSLGFEVVSFTGITAADWEAAFAADIVIIPELERSLLDLSSDARSAINDQLAVGKGLIVMGSADEHEEQLLNSLRGWALVGSIIENDGTLTKSTQRDVFTKSPAELSTFSGTYLLASNSIPADSNSVYTQLNDTAVFYGEGIGYLGYDWFSGSDTDWDPVLEDMISALLAPGLQQFSISSLAATVNEGNEGLTEATFTVSRIGNPDVSASVDWSIDLAAANLSEADFGETSGTIDFPAGVSEQTLSVSITTDLIVELDEVFTVSISNPQGILPVIVANASSADGTIVNDDAAILTLTGNAQLEGDQGAPVLTFTASLDQLVDVPVTGLFSTLSLGGSTTTEDVDYDSITDEPISIPAFTAQTTISVTISPDNAAELDEIVQAAISNLESGGRNVAQSDQNPETARGTILDDDFSPIGNDDGVYEVVEDGSLSVAPDLGILANDTDEDDGLNALTVLLVDDVSNGSLNLMDDGSFSYTPNPDYFGADSFTYRSSDGTNQSADTNVSIEVIERIDLALGADILQTPLVAGGEALDTFRITVTNKGPSRATDVRLALNSIFPPGVLLTNSTTSLGSFDGDFWTINTLDENESATLVLKIQASQDSSSGANNVAFTIAATDANQTDTDPSNDTATAAVSVISAADTGTAITAAPGLELQSGLLTGRVTVTNSNEEALPAFRLYIGNLPDDVKVHNAHGIRAFGDPATDRPFLLYNQTLAASASVTLTVEFFRATLDADFDPVYEIELLPFSESLVANDPNQTNIPVERQEVLSNGDFLIEIASIPDTVYAVEYSENMTDWTRVPATITAVANRLQWIDNGAPKTSSHPSQVASRFYRFVIVTPANQ